jgi:hypothetical protein
MGHMHSEQTVVSAKHVVVGATQVLEAAGSKYFGLKASVLFCVIFCVWTCLHSQFSSYLLAVRMK